MSEQYPLHVRVAAALRWQGFANHSDVPSFFGGWYGDAPPDSDARRWRCQVPRYDTDWRATGPLIEKYEIGVRPANAQEYDWNGTHTAERWLGGYEWATGKGPLDAVCNLILQLSEKGKLA